jgi:heat shock protein HslJ
VNAAPQPSPTPNPLVGFNWTVSALNGTPPTGTITTVFDNNGRITGNDGCNSYSGTYTASSNSLTITLGPSTPLSCGDPIDSEAATFLQILTSATSYGIANNQLTINGTGTITYDARPQPR